MACDKMITLNVKFKTIVSSFAHLLFFFCWTETLLIVECWKLVNIDFNSVDGFQLSLLKLCFS